MPCYSPLKGYRDAVTGALCFDRQLDSRGNSLASEEMEVACGQCLGCRLDRSRMWCARICHEASLYEFGRGNSFITLTYDEENLPSDWSLKKRDFQLFMKRFRKFFMVGRTTDRDDFGRLVDPIRFFHVGEYGDICKHRKSVSECDFCHVGRPHYHAIMFNVCFEDQELVAVREDYEIFESKNLSELWGKGWANFGSVTADSAGYVSRYALKKITGYIANEHYESFDTATGEVIQLQPEYATMSRNPGLARGWFEKYSADVFPSDEVPIPGKGVLKGVPRYYDDLQVHLDECLMLEVKRKRIQFRDEHADEYTADRLMSKYQVKVAQIGSLKREL